MKSTEVVRRGASSDSVINLKALFLSFLYGFVDLLFLLFWTLSIIGFSIVSNTSEKTLNQKYKQKCGNLRIFILK